MTEHKNIQVIPKQQINEVRNFASRWYMKELGTAIFDDGEPQTDQHQIDETALFFENSIPEKTKAFMQAMHDRFPDMSISLSPLSPEDGDDMTRFNETQIELSMDDLTSPDMIDKQV